MVQEGKLRGVQLQEPGPVRQGRQPRELISGKRTWLLGRAEAALRFGPSSLGSL
jgi:hypothetical protein